MRLPGVGGRPKVPGRSACGKVLACKDPVGPLDCKASLTEGRPRSVNGPEPVAMALTKSLTRLDHPTLQTHGEGGERETLLALSQRKLNALGMPVCYIDACQRYRFVDRAFLDWTGKPGPEVLGREVVEVDGRELYQLYHAYLEAALSGERVSFERQLSSVKRNAFWIRVDYYPDRSLRGDVRGVLATYSDVDNIKRVELEAGEREHRLRIVTDSVGLPICYFDRSLRLRFANKPYGNYIGIPVDDILGQPLKNFLAPDALAEMQGYVERAFAGATVRYDRRERPASGELRWVRITLFPDREPGGKTGGAFAVINDIEDDTRIREALKSQEAQMRLFADNIPGPIAYLDRKLNYTFVNQAFANWVCRPQDQIYGKTPYEVMPHDVNAFLRPIIKRAQEGENVDYERIGVSAAGKRRWMHGRIAPDLDVNGAVRGLYCTEYDIHDLKLTEQALATREEQLRLFTDNIPEPVVYVDQGDKYTFVNDAFLRVVGLDRDDVIGKSSEEVLGPDVFEAQRPHLERAAKGESVTYERAGIDANGRALWLRNRIVPDFRFDGTIKGYYTVWHDITDLKQAQDALAARESQLRAIMDGVPAPVAYIDRDERCQYVNRTFLHYFGLTAEQVTELRLRDVVGHGIYQSAQVMLARALRGESTSFDRLVPGANGARRWMTIRVVPDMSAEREIAGAFVLMNDIHGLKQAQEALRASEAELRLSMDNVPARVAYIDREYRFRFINRHNEEWLSESRKELTGRRIGEVVGEARGRQLQPLLTRVLAGETISTEQLLVQPNGEQRWESIHFAPNRDAEGNVIGIYAVHTDIHDQKRNEEALRRANWMLSSHINNTPLAVLEWDRDFRLVRWSPQAENIFGWRAEEVLGMPLTGSQLTHESDREAVVELINKLMAGEEPRATGLNRNYRKDGDTIWCEWYHSCLLDEQGRIGPILSLVQDAVSQPFEIEEHDIYVTSSTGISVYPDDGDAPEELLKHADVAMYRSKELGRNTYQFFDADLAVHRLAQHTLERALRTAVKEEALTLHYQPVVRLSDKAIIGAEALLRWHDAEHGDVKPQVFIPLAEESGLIHALGEWVMRTAAAQCAAWHQAGLPLKVSVNLSGRQFYREDLAQRISQIVREAGCKPEWVELEVTESSLLHDLDSIKKVLQQLREEGFAVAIDDFGTGYSSLSHLKHFPIDTLKIDISFIADIETDPGDAAITEAIIALARGLGLRVVAEGVATREQFEFLGARGCHCFQGFWVSEALPADKFIQFSRAQH